MLYAADFETNNNREDCRVWAAGIAPIEPDPPFICGNSIDWFINYAFTSEGTFYFHNAKFDGEFIIYYLLNHNFTFSKSNKIKEKEFTTLVSAEGQFYSLRAKNEHGQEFKVIDSYKIIPIPIDGFTKAFGLSMSKLDLDYNTYREKGHILTPDEKEYLSHDVLILAEGLRIMFNQGLTKNTQAANALEDYKKIIGEKAFDRRFPNLGELDEKLRKSYKGGFVYAAPDHAGKTCGAGLVFDYNSLFPSVMYYSLLPFGRPLHYTGKYKPDPTFPLYIQVIDVMFTLKPGFIPTIQIKNSMRFMPTEYIEDSGDLPIRLTLTSVDLYLLLTHYNIESINYIEGWKFKGSRELFKPYINKWYKVKQEATITKNAGLRFIAKRMQNALYGKFGTSGEGNKKEPVIGPDGQVTYKLYEGRKRKTLYVPVASFITAWGRYKTISAAQSVYPYFRYSDTDSIHLELPIPEELIRLKSETVENFTREDLEKYGINLPEAFQIDPVKLGFLACEGMFTSAKFLRPKTYVEVIDGKLKVTCAGLPAKCYDQVTFDNFEPGKDYFGKLRPVHVPGGIVLEECFFTITGKEDIIKE